MVEKNEQDTIELKTNRVYLVRECLPQRKKRHVLVDTTSAVRAVDATAIERNKHHKNVNMGARRFVLENTIVNESKCQR
jgi:hypothetical protein